MAKVHVWYKLSGEIVAVGRAPGKAKCLPVGDENQAVLEIDIEDSAVSNLHKTHTVDPLRRTIVKLQDK